MTRTFTRIHAEVVAKKLGASIDRKAKNHDKAIIKHGGIIVAHFGIRRSSKEVGHDFLPDALHLQRNQVRRLIECTLGRDEYFDKLKAMGKL